MPHQNWILNLGASSTLHLEYKEWNLGLVSIQILHISFISFEHASSGPWTTWTGYDVHLQQYVDPWIVSTSNHVSQKANQSLPACCYPLYIRQLG